MHIAFATLMIVVRCTVHFIFSFTFGSKAVAALQINLNSSNGVGNEKERLRRDRRTGAHYTLFCEIALKFEMFLDDFGATAIVAINPTQPSPASNDSTRRFTAIYVLYYVCIHFSLTTYTHNIFGRQRLTFASLSFLAAMLC